MGVLTNQEALERANRALAEVLGKPIGKSTQAAVFRENTPAASAMPARLTGAALPGGKAEEKPEPNEPVRAAANSLLGRVGMRLMELESGTTVGLWSDLDGPPVRAALAVFGSDVLPVRYVDGDVPMRFELRRVAGEPVPGDRARRDGAHLGGTMGSP